MSGIVLDPVATYRVQLTPDFTFAEVTGILGHLRELGVSHLYLSPILEAMPGSQHGYDWAPPARISEVLGGADGFRLLREHARARGIGMILDIVPNHVGVRSVDHNPWWAHLLTHGLESEYATYFDLDTAPTDGIIYLPYLGRAEDLADLTIDDRGWLVLGDIALPTAPGTVAPGDDAHTVHDRQHYRLVPHDSRRIGYRRFMAVNELAALRQEVPEVYDATHGWLQELIAEDLLDGVRIDHVDGLCDPIGYLNRLRADLGPDRLIYVEKTMEVNEELESLMPVDGTTGYEVLRVIEARFTAPTGAIELEEIFRSLSGQVGDGDRLWDRARVLRQTVFTDSFPDRLQRITQLFAARAPEVGAHLIGQAVSLLVSSAPVSRPGYPSLTPAVLDRLDKLAVENLAVAPACEVIANALRNPEYAPEALSRLGEANVVVYAQAIEGIGFSRTARLVSTQDLGCSPLIPSINRQDFHECFTRRAHQWPRGLNTISTHDTKRSEDVRARIATIAQTPQRWRIFVVELWRLVPPPDKWVCYYLLQNLVGVWPTQGMPDETLHDRFAAFATHAMREGRIVSSWTEPDPDSEAQVHRWLDDLQTGTPAQLISSFVQMIADAGREEALSRKVLSLLLPGVGDIYQGTQWWDDSLADPDNRRPVDYSQSLGHPKIEAIRTSLAVRRRHLASFGPGSDYTGVTVRGAAVSHLTAFSRGYNGVAEVVVVAVRLALMFDDLEFRAKAHIELPPGHWVETTSGEEFTGDAAADTLLALRPYAILERQN